MELLKALVVISTVNLSVVAILTEPVKGRWPEFYDDWKGFVPVLSLLTGFGLAFWANFNVLAYFTDAVQDPLVGRVVTGLMAGGGAKMLHDVVDALKELPGLLTALLAAKPQA